MLLETLQKIYAKRSKNDSLINRGNMENEPIIDNIAGLIHVELYRQVCLNRIATIKVTESEKGRLKKIVIFERASQKIKMYEFFLNK
uniref:Uncharacterized protein n=1 Tax=Romanomermis culicivorax TaxID=13658 RepID=A0A915I3B6_ROMCU